MPCILLVDFVLETFMVELDNFMGSAELKLDGPCLSELNLIILLFSYHVFMFISLDF